MDQYAAELAHLASGGSPRVFYAPDWGSNGHLRFDPAGFPEFVRHGVPEGFQLDLAAWEALPLRADGTRPEAPLRPLDAPGAEPEGLVAVPDSPAPPAAGPLAEAELHRDGVPESAPAPPEELVTWNVPPVTAETVAPEVAPEVTGE